METERRRLRDLLAAAFEEVVAICASPFRRVHRWRVERHLDRRLDVFSTLDAFSAEETEQLRPLLIEHERTLSRVDAWQDLCAMPTFLAHLLLPLALLTVFIVAFEDAATYGAGALTLSVPILAYLAGIALTWRTTRRALPPPRFDVVGSRQYRLQPWRVLAALVWVFATQFAGYHLQIWGLKIESDWYYLVLYAGGGLAIGSALAGLWLVLRLLGNVGEWLLESAETFRHPEAVIVDNYLAMLHELHRLDVNHKSLASSPASRRKLIDMLELSARCMEDGLRRDLKGLDPHTDEWVRNHTAEIAAATRMMKKDVISGDRETEAKLFGRFRDDFRCAVLGGWTQLPRVAQPAYPAESSHSLVLRVVASVLLVGLPLALVIVLRSDKSDKQAETADAVDPSAPPDADGSALPDTGSDDSRGATKSLRDGARDWDANLQVIAGILASIILLMSRFDDLATRFSRQRSQPRESAAADGPT